MQKLLFTTVLVFLLHSAFAQTSLTIIGTSHTKTAHFNDDSLYNMLVKIRPDIILMELDTSLMDNEGNYKGKAITITENEEVASRRYKKAFPNTLFRRFDIEDRNHYYDVHHTFAMESEVGKSLDSLYSIGQLSSNNLENVRSIYDANRQLNELSNMDIYGLNSEKYMAVAGQREYTMYNKLLEVVGSAPQLKQYYDFQKEDGDFWIRRNDRMIHNISGYIKQFPGKKIVVLTGSYHTYYQTKGLKPLQSKLNFKLAGLPDRQ